MNDVADDGHRPEPRVASGGGPMSVQRTLAILDVLADSPAPLSLATLTRELATPKPSLLSLLKELLALGYVRRDEVGRFALAGRAYRLALRINASDSPGVLVHETLQRLSASLSMTVAFGYLDPAARALIYADRCEAYSPIRYVVKLAYPLDIHPRAMGRLLLAYEDESTWKEWLGAEPYKRFTPHTQVHYTKLATELRKIRRNGIAWTNSELHVGIAGCALPVMGADGRVAAGITVQTLHEALDPNRDKVEASLRETAEELGRELALRRITAANISVVL